ncbi:MAG: penicillin-binding protein activator [Thermodesulfobacteriota bacterium]
METKASRLALILALLAFTLITASGCLEGVLPKKKVIYPPSESVEPKETRPPSGSEQELLQEAEKAQDKGRFKEALAKLEAFLKEYPDSAYADMALAMTGQIREKQGEKEQAVKAYREIIQKHPHSRFQNEAGLRLTALYLDLGRYEQARDQAGDMLARVNKKNEKARLRILLARAHLGQGNHGPALDLLRKAHQETSDQMDKQEAGRVMKAVIASMSPEELYQAQTEIGRDFPGAYLAYVLAYRLYETGRKDEAKAQLGHFQKQFPDHQELNREALTLSRAMESGGAPPPLTVGQDYLKAQTARKAGTGTSVETAAPAGEKAGKTMEQIEGPVTAMEVACILPLSQSKQAQYGQEVLKGLKLAFKTYRPQTPGFKSNLVVLDSKGEPDLAARMTAKASSNGNIAAAVGPLLSREAAAAAPRAEEESLPLLTITQKQDITQAGRHVYRLFLTPKAQAEIVARYAVQVLGLRRLAILYPNETYGQEMRDYFGHEVKRLGGEIVKVVAYNPKGTEFSAEIQKLAGVGRAVKKVAAGRKVQVDFEAVFLPDSYRAVAMIAPQFAYHDIMTVRLLGTSLWHTPRLLTSAARYTQRCVIPTPFYADGDRAEVKRFVAAYAALSQDEKNETGAKKESGEAKEPGQFEAYGYDAGTLVLTLLDKGRITSREDLLKALNKMAPFPGVTGRFTFDSNRDYKTEPILLTVEGSEFKLIR